MYNLLIVDDELDILEVLRDTFSEDCDKIFTADNVEDALKIAKTETLHTILTDLKIGETSGADLIEKIQEEVNPVPPILVFSAYLGSFTEQLTKQGGENLRFAIHKPDDGVLKEVVLNSLKMGMKKLSGAA